MLERLRNASRALTPGQLASFAAAEQPLPLALTSAICAHWPARQTLSCAAWHRRRQLEHREQTTNSSHALRGDKFFIVSLGIMRATAPSSQRMVMMQIVTTCSPPLKLFAHFPRGTNGAAEVVRNQSLTFTPHAAKRQTKHIGQLSAARQHTEGTSAKSLPGHSVPLDGQRAASRPSRAARERLSWPDGEGERRPPDD